MKVYRVLAYLVAAGVAFQAAVLAWGVFALSSWVQEGGVLDKAAMESGGGGGGAGLTSHFYGAMGVAVLGLAFLVTSFFAKVPGGILWAGITFALIVLQWVLGLVSFDLPALGLVHGINALVILAVALMAGMRAARAVRGGSDAAPVAVAAPVV